jgi:hypothetical protein
VVVPMAGSMAPMVAAVSASIGAIGGAVGLGRGRPGGCVRAGTRRDDGKGAALVGAARQWRRAAPLQGKGAGRWRTAVAHGGRRSWRTERTRARRGTRVHGCGMAPWRARAGGRGGTPAAGGGGGGRGRPAAGGPAAGEGDRRLKKKRETLNLAL